MTEHATIPDGPTPTEQAQTSVMSPPPAPRRRSRWAIPAGALVLGVVIGLGIGFPAGHSDPTASAQYHSLQKRLDGVVASGATLRAQVSQAQASNQAAQMSAAAVASAAAASQAALAQQAAAVASQQAALTAAQQQIAANSIEEGTWTVGVDVAPGTYRTSQPVSSDCYWKITKSGTNGADIIKNDIPGGGIPTVTLSTGQDFTNQGCGTFVKQ
jgi:hypothetical protein